MNSRLKSAKRHIREFIGRHWSDQKLAEVYAFNRDGKMNWLSVCSCILAVTVSDVLHTTATVADTERYADARRIFDTAQLVESSYRILGIAFHLPTTMPPDFHWLRNVRLSAILRGEIRRRDHLANVRRLVEAIDAEHMTEMFAEVLT
jgi:hypothetical protein